MTQARSRGPAGRPASRPLGGPAASRHAALLLALMWLLPATIPARAQDGPPAPRLGLAEAETLALATDPALPRHEALARAEEEVAVAAAQLPDPVLKLGLLNFPTDTLSRTQEPMTQIRLGLQQRIPRGDSREIAADRRLTMAEVQRAERADRRRQVLRGVRKAWWELAYWLRAQEVIERSRGLFEQLVEITRYQYAAGRHNQQDVVRAELELSRLEDRLTRIRSMQDQARAELARWVGPEAARRDPAVDVEAAGGGLALAGGPGVADLQRLVTGLPDHPRLRAEQARIESARLGVDLARQSYRPGWMVDLGYGLRGGQNPDGSGRADFLSASLAVDLPLFPGQRQDRQVAASDQRLEAARRRRDEVLLDLRRQLERHHAAWQRLRERVVLYRERLLPQAERNAEASLDAYQNDNTDFTTLVRARLAELDTRLDAARVETDLARARADLDYFSGE